MKIVREDRENRSTMLSVTIDEKDYAEEVENTLRKYRKEAKMPGFRPGKVPMGVIKKMYEKATIAEKSYQIASQAVIDYIEENKIEHIGDLMPAEEQQPIDFENDTSFDFNFEIGLSPEIDIELSEKDKITRYKITPEKEMYEGFRSNLVRRYGKMEEVEEVAKDEALTVTFDNEEMNVAEAYVGLVQMDEEERKPFIGKKVGDKMEIDVNELYKTPRQRAAILQVEEEELENINPKFTMTIDAIRQFVEPEMNEEFFKTAFPDGTITSEEQLDEFVNNQVNKELNRESDYIVATMLRNMLIEMSKPVMPEEFLKRWLYNINEGKFTMEQIEADFPQFLEQMKWNLIQKFFVDQMEVKIEEEEAIEAAKEHARMQFAQYGMAHVADEMLEGYAQQILQNQEEARQIYDKLFEDKVVEAILPKITVEEKEVSVEEFTKLAQELLNPVEAMVEEAEEAAEKEKK